MAQIKVELSGPPFDGMDIKFKAPCDCTEVTGLLVSYPEGSQGFTFRDSHGNNLAGIGNLFSRGAYVKVLVDTVRGYAYIQNADNNGYLNGYLLAAAVNTYTQTGDSLVGIGDNGKFKATESGTFGSFQVNGELCDVKLGDEASIDLIAGCWYTFILDGNTVNFNSGGAGGGLSFKVVCGATRPASPKNNMIWVNTDEITSWVFSATEPENPEPGAVWIRTGVSGDVEFNALKKNAIQVYPRSVKQRIDGRWVFKEAHIWQYDEWQQFSYEWAGELYDSGNEYEDITGGFVAIGMAVSATYPAASAPAIERNSDNLKATQKSSASAGSVVTANKIDLTGFTKLCYTGTFYGIQLAGTSALCVWSDLGTYQTDNCVAKLPNIQATAIVDGTLDISGVPSGEYYVGFHLYHLNSYVQITKMWLE